ncbi:hypothetical protein LPC08_25435 (plasmid) [Roseomonas sp. OT10]|uniref:hypothetical protein n=1 Tax=Roseomonas cutis TaxID=2897332 RepID=UPI001E3675DD|nr:hypothetical protein [Roseomonas sp. OT10]UFN51607.1 hypothetical protein LPC08_25435 [Roseomonas sp. OT10]
MMQRATPKIPLRQDPPLQITLFETDDDGRYSNTIDLYDLAPRFVFYTESRKEGSYLKSIRRQFEHGGLPYSLLLRPGRIVRSDGTEREQFPGEREQIVEAVIHRLATDRGKLTVNNEKVRLTFTMYEIREELRKVRHLFAIEEIKDALTILHTAVVEITRVDKKSTQVMSSSSFPVLALRRREDEDRAYLEFNPLVEGAIKDLRYRHMNYEWLMRISHPLSRWLYKRLCQTFGNVTGIGPAIVPTASMTAMEIARDGGVAPRSRPRDTLRNVGNAVDILVKQGIIEQVEGEVIREGRKNVDILFDFVPTATFLEEIRRSDRLYRDAHRRMTEAGGERPDRFVRVDRGITARVRAERRQLALLSDDSKAAVAATGG